MAYADAGRERETNHLRETGPLYRCETADSHLKNRAPAESEGLQVEDEADLDDWEAHFSPQGMRMDEMPEDGEEAALGMGMGSNCETLLVDDATMVHVLKENGLLRSVGGRRSISSYWRRRCSRRGVRRIIQRIGGMLEGIW